MCPPPWKFSRGWRAIWVEIDSEDALDGCLLIGLPAQSFRLLGD